MRGQSWIQLSNRPARVPNTESAERRQARLEREAIRAEHRAFLDDFDRQVAELEAKDRAKEGGD